MGRKEWGGAPWTQRKILVSHLTPSCIPLTETLRQTPLETISGILAIHVDITAIAGRTLDDKTPRVFPVFPGQLERDAGRLL